MVKKIKYSHSSMDIKTKKNISLELPVFVIIIILETWKIGEFSAYEWDEARRGIQAMGMLRNHDLINYYYLNELDTWTAKPPLTSWLICLSYKLWGFNEFALRFHSLVATILFFIYSYHLIRLYKSQNFALITILSLAACNGIIGFHVGRTGDADSLLLLFVTSSAYYFLKYHDFNDKKAIFFSAIALGFAFYAKGFACIFLLFGLILYSAIQKKIIRLFSDWRIYAGVLIWFCFIGSWFVLVKQFGKQYEASQFIGNNSWTTMIYYDIIGRFSGNISEGEYDLFHVFHVLDIRFNLWNYLFYLALIYFGIKLYKRKKAIREILRSSENRLLLLSFCTSFCLFLIISLSYNKHQWYLAPALLFISIITMDFIFRLKKHRKWINYALIALFSFTILHKFFEHNNPKNEISLFFKNHKELLSQKDQIFVSEYVPQNYILYLTWLNNTSFWKGSSDFGKNSIVFLRKKTAEKRNLKIINCLDGFCIAE